MSEPREFWAPLKNGDVIGWLTLVELGEPYTWCVCRCGKRIKRNTMALNAARRKSAEPKCKECERGERKRKNPGAIPYASPVWYR